MKINKPFKIGLKFLAIVFCIVAFVVPHDAILFPDHTAFSVGYKIEGRGLTAMPIIYCPSYSQNAKRTLLLQMEELKKKRNSK